MTVSAIEQLNKTQDTNPEIDIWRLFLNYLNNKPKIEDLAAFPSNFVKQVFNALNQKFGTSQGILCSNSYISNYKDVINFPYICSDSDVPGMSDLALFVTQYQEELTAKIFIENILNAVKKRSEIKNIIDIACGKLFLSSVMLAKLGYNMTAMDPAIMPLPKYLTHFNIAPVRENLIYGNDYNKLMANQHFLISNKPCNATLNIAYEADKQDIDYIIALCSCSMKGLNGKQVNKTGDIQSKANYIKKILPNTNIININKSTLISNVKLV